MISFKDELWCDINKMSPFLFKTPLIMACSTTLKLCRNYHSFTSIISLLPSTTESTGSKSFRRSSRYSFFKTSKHPMVWKHQYQLINHSSVSDTSININYVFTEAEAPFPELSFSMYKYWLSSLLPPSRWQTWELYHSWRESNTLSFTDRP